MRISIFLASSKELALTTEIGRFQGSFFLGVALLVIAVLVPVPTWGSFVLGTMDTSRAAPTTGIFMAQNPAQSPAGYLLDASARGEKPVASELAERSCEFFPDKVLRRSYYDESSQTQICAREQQQRRFCCTPQLQFDEFVFLRAARGSLELLPVWDRGGPAPVGDRGQFDLSN